MAEGFFDIAQICRNGHVANDSVKRFPEGNQRFCAKCGEVTIMECDSCHASIRGYYHLPGVIGYTERKKTAPGFCHHCGQAYPWTQKRLETAGALAAEFEELAPGDRELLQRSLNDLIREGPATELAAVRCKKIMKKLGKESFEMMKLVITDLASEPAKKALFRVGT